MGKKSKDHGKKALRVAREEKRRAIFARLAPCNALDDCGSSCLAPPLLAFEGLALRFAAARDVDASTRDALFALLEANMRAHYEASDWGWDEREKRGDLASADAKFLVAEDAAGAVAGFVHFRFEPDDDDEPRRAALYVREIQVAAARRGNGLGRRLMSLLHVVAAKLDLDAVMLTVFKANAAAQRFYVEKLKYAVDGDDPANHGVDDACYVILSRPLKRALAPSN